MPEAEVAAGGGLANVFATQTVAVTLYLIGKPLVLGLGVNPDLSAESSRSGESLNASELWY